MVAALLLISHMSENHLLSIYDRIFGEDFPVSNEHPVYDLLGPVVCRTCFKMHIYFFIKNSACPFKRNENTVFQIPKIIFLFLDI